MLIGATDSTVQQQNPYVNKAESTQSQAINAADKADAAAEAKQSSSFKEPRDEYIPGGDQPESSAGVYRLEKAEDGKQRIVFDRPDAAEQASDQDQINANPSQPADASSEEKAEPSKKAEDPGGKEGSCTVDTDSVDREIKQLKEKKQQLEQQLNSVQGDDHKREELERQLTQLESELNMKDNDSYRQQHSTFTMS